jgi:phosphoribosylformimino-5-aminoimidazole carboxamide ribotide isomerase
MILYPSIDLRGGRVVRLLQGDYDRELDYGDDAVAVAKRYVDAGAEWVHVVDLDAAKSGELANLAVVASVAAVARVQCGGGVRTVEAARALADAGVARAIVGTAAVERPAIVAEIATSMAVAVSVDVRGEEVAVRGWLEGSGRRLEDVLPTLSAADALIITAINRDATMEGPDLDVLRKVLAITSLPVISAGGVGSLDHLRALADLGGLHGAIVGRALYEGAFTVEEALAACAA